MNESAGVNKVWTEQGLAWHTALLLPSERQENPQTENPPQSNWHSKNK